MEKETLFSRKLFNPFMHICARLWHAAFVVIYFNQMIAFGIKHLSKLCLHVKKSNLGLTYVSASNVNFASNPCFLKGIINM